MALPLQAHLLLDLLQILLQFHIMDPLARQYSKNSQPTAGESAETDQEKATPESPESPEASAAPDGGAAAWLVAAGGSALFFCSLGFSNSFGSFAEYYLTHQLHDQSPADIAWIGSLSAFLQFFAGMVGGPMFDRFGAWVCIYSFQR